MFELADNETVKARLETCKKCPLMTIYKLAMVCGEFLKKTDKTCGCIISAKAQFINQKCPSNKW